MSNIISKLREEIRVIQKRIETIQDKCSHPDVAKVAKSDDGGWDLSVRYWHECTCNLCEKTWTQDQ